jgi:hypothetical protein
LLRLWLFVPFVAAFFLVVSESQVGRETQLTAGSIGGKQETT